VEFPQELSVFFGEAISPRLGTFIQITYDGGEGTVGIDNVSLRYANHGKLASKEVIYGLTLNNSPTVQDVWNTTPVWGFPFGPSDVAPAPAAAPMIAGSAPTRSGTVTSMARRRCTAPRSKAARIRRIRLRK
jgi:hypothetical protein